MLPVGIPREEFLYYLLYYSTPLPHVILWARVDELRFAALRERRCLGAVMMTTIIMMIISIMMRLLLLLLLIIITTILIIILIQLLITDGKRQGFERDLRQQALDGG